MKKIVYYSTTGHTKEYAELLGNDLNIEVIPFSQRAKISEDDEIIFMSWVFADKIKKLNHMSKKYNLICVAAVGMNFKSDSNSELLIKTNKVNVPLIYLQGGINYDKLKGINAKLLKMVAKQVISENKNEDQSIIEVFKNGGNFVSKEMLKEIKKHIVNR